VPSHFNWSLQIYTYFNLDVTWGWLTPRPACLIPKNDPVAIYSVSPRVRLGNLAHTGIRSPDHPALSMSLYLLSYPGLHTHRAYPLLRRTGTSVGEVCICTFGGSLFRTVEHFGYTCSASVLCVGCIGLETRSKCFLVIYVCREYSEFVHQSGTMSPEL